MPSRSVELATSWFNPPHLWFAAQDVRPDSGIERDRAWVYFFLDLDKKTRVPYCGGSAPVGVPRGEGEPGTHSRRV